MENQEEQQEQPIKWLNPKPPPEDGC